MIARALSLLVGAALGASLPEGPGKELVEQTCTHCHSAQTLLQNRLDRPTWDRVITKMQKQNGLWELAPEARATLLDYLDAKLAPSTRADTLDGLGPRVVNPLPE